VEVLIEAFLGAVFRVHNCIWVAVSPPGTGYCGQLCAKIVAEGVGWRTSYPSYSDQAIPAAVASGLAQPVLPRFQTLAQGITRFKAFAGMKPSLRPARPSEAPVCWNGCTIEQYASAHHMQPVIDKISLCRDSLVEFMSIQVRLSEQIPYPHLRCLLRPHLRPNDRY
jgi:hypothetical protein